MGYHYFQHFSFYRLEPDDFSFLKGVSPYGVHFYILLIGSFKHVCWFSWVKTIIVHLFLWSAIFFLYLTDFDILYIKVSDDKQTY